ncbi:morphogenic membrane protein MmpB [Streptomyces sp. 796.1]
MLWSDPPNEPPDELRVTQTMVRRAGTVLAVASVVLMLIIALGA